MVTLITHFHTCKKGIEGKNLPFSNSRLPLSLATSLAACQTPGQWDVGRWRQRILCTQAQQGGAVFLAIFWQSMHV